MGRSRVSRIGGSIAVAAVLFLASLIIAPLATAVDVSQPAYQDGNVEVTIEFADPDRVGIAALRLHFACDSGSFTEEMAPTVGAASLHATLVGIVPTGLTGGYGYLQGTQTGYGYTEGGHGSYTGETGLAGGYGYGPDNGYGYGYGYGYTGGNVRFVFHMEQAEFLANESCTLVVELVPEGGFGGDFQSPRSAPFTPRIPPTADAGQPDTVPAGAAVTLDGSLSYDANDGPGPLSYLWTQTGGPTVALTAATTVSPGFTAPAEVAADTSLTFQLTVSDTLDTSVDTVVITVQKANLAPVVDAGLPQTVVEGDPVQLAGTVNDETTDLDLAWTVVSGPTVPLTGADTLTASFVAPAVNADTSIALRLTASDGALSGSDDVAILVQNNVPPLASAGLDRTIAVGPNTLDGSGTDPNVGDAATLAFSWLQTDGPTVAMSGGATATPQIQVLPAHAGSLLAFRLEVTDRHGLSDIDTVTHYVDIPPVADAGPDQGVYEGTVVSLRGFATDRDNDTSDLSYLWTGPVPLTGAQTLTPTFTAPQVTGAPLDLAFTLTVSDGVDATSDLVNVRVFDGDGIAGVAYYLHSTGCLAAGVGITAEEPVLTAQQTSASTGNDTGDGESCINLSLPPLAKPLDFGTPAVPQAFPAGTLVSGKVHLAMLLPEDASAASADVTLLQDGTPLGTVALPVTDAALAFGALNAGLKPTFIPLAFQFPAARAITTSPLTLRLDVDGGAGYMVGLEGNHASQFRLAGVPGSTNLPPVARTVADFTVPEGSDVLLTHASTDADGDAVTASWRQVAGPDAVLGGARFVAPQVDATTLLTFQLTVSDGRLSSLPDVVNVTVTNTGSTPTPPPPVADAGGDRIVIEGEPVVLVGSHTGGQGAAPLAWHQVSGSPIALSQNGAQLAFTAPAVTGTQHVGFRYSVRDTLGRVSSDEVLVTILDQGSPATTSPPATTPPTPTTPVVRCGDGDRDGDGVPDRVECQAGSNPDSPTSRPDYDTTTRLSVLRQPGNNTLSWTPQPGAVGYQLWSSNSPFVLLATVDGDETTYNHTSDSAKPTTKYKLTYFVERTAAGGYLASADGLASLLGWDEDRSGADAVPARDASETAPAGNRAAVLVVLAVVLVAFLLVLLAGVGRRRA